MGEVLCSCPRDAGNRRVSVDPACRRHLGHKGLSYADCWCPSDGLVGRAGVAADCPMHGSEPGAAWGSDLTVDEVISKLQALRAEHGNLVVSTGGPEGDVVSDVWFEECGPNIYIG